MPGLTTLDQDNPWVLVQSFLQPFPEQWKHDILAVMRVTMTEYDLYQYQLDDIIIHEIAQSMHVQKNRGEAHEYFQCVEGFSGWAMLTLEMRKAQLKAVALDKKYDVELDLGTSRGFIKNIYALRRLLKSGLFWQRC